MRQVFHFINATAIYGAEKMLLDLIKEQKKLKNLNACYVSFSEKDPLLDEIKKNKLNFILLKKFSIFDLFSFIKQQNKKSIFHSHGYKFNIIFAFFNIFVFDKFFITTIHGYTKPKFFSKLKFYFLLDKIALYCLDKIILIDPQKKLLLHKLFKKKISYINNGIKYKKQINLKRKYKRIIKEPYLVCLSRFSFEKNLSFLIKSFALLKKKDSKIKLIVAGNGSKKAKLNKLIIDLNLQNHVYLYDFLKTTKPIILNAKACVLVSKQENMPIFLLEAMRYKKPVIATNVGAIKKMFLYGKTANILNDFSTLEFLKSYQNLSKLQTRKSKQENFINFKKHYTAKKMALNYFNLYKTLTNE